MIMMGMTMIMVMKSIMNMSMCVMINGCCIIIGVADVHETGDYSHAQYAVPQSAVSSNETRQK